VRPATAEELATEQGLDLPRPLRMVAVSYTHLTLPTKRI